jgi:adenylate cyclase
MKRLLIFVISCALFVLNTNPVNAQKIGQVRIDSLMNELSGAKADSGQVKTLIDLSQTYANVDPVEGVKYGEKALMLAEKIGYKKGKAQARFSEGLNYLYLQDFDNAELNLNASLKIGEEIGSKYIIASVYNYMGVMHDYRAEYPEAQKYYQKAIEIFIELKSKSNVSGSLMNMGISKMCMSENKEALYYFEKSLELDQELNDTAGMTTTYINLGILYFNLSDYPKSLESYFKALKFQEEKGDERGIGITYGNIASVYLELDDYAKSLDYNLKSLKICEKINDKFGVSGRLNDIGEVYRAEMEYDKAMEYFRKALVINEETENKNYEAINLVNISDIFCFQSDYTSAVEYAMKAMKISREISSMGNLALSYLCLGKAYKSAATDSNRNHLDKLCGGNKILALKNAEIYADSAVDAFRETGELIFLKESYLLLSGSQEMLGKYKEALNNYKNFVVFKDSVYNTDNERKIAKIEAKRTEELNQKKLEIKDLQISKARNERWYFVAGLILLICLSVVLFNRYRLKKKANIVITREKKRSDDLLLNILPSEVAEELKEKGFADAKHFDEVSVLFTDFKNFSRISERLSPVELVAEIDFCFKAFDNIIGKYNIEKIKTIGDSYMAAGGLPVANKTNAIDVVKAALEIQQFMNGHAQKRRDEGREIFEIRLGIHTGPVVAGIVGIKKFAYDIWGDTVNIASRMESSGETGKVNISGSTYELVKSEFKCLHRGKVEAKNKGMIDMYFVEND